MFLKEKPGSGQEWAHTTDGGGRGAVAPTTGRQLCAPSRNFLTLLGEGGGCCVRDLGGNECPLRQGSQITVSLGGSQGSCAKLSKPKGASQTNLMYCGVSGGIWLL